jgi:L-amino acid N-acyltransferase YncA
MYLVREAVDRDWEAIHAIWLSGSTVSLGFAADFPEAATWLRTAVNSQNSIFKFWVAENVGGQIVGWQSLMPTRNNPVMRTLVAESSTYCSLTLGEHGLGTQLIEIASRHADNSPLQYIVGTISEGNAAMRKIVAKAGWKEIGQIPASDKPPACPQAVFVVYVAKAQA